MATKTDTSLEKALAAALKAAGVKSTGSKTKRKPFGKGRVGRLWRKEREGWKERKAARKGNREPKIKTRRARFAERFKARVERLRYGSAHCGNCGARMSGKDAAGHTCGGKSSPEKFTKMKAQLRDVARKEVKRQGTNREARRDHRQARKDTMTRPARVADTVIRRTALVAGFAGRCTECNSIIRNHEATTHKCWSAERTAGTDSRADNTTQPGGKRLGTDNATQPNPAPATSNGATPPATQPNRKAGPAMTSPNGKGGGGGPSGHAQAIAQAMHNWAQNVPGTHSEMEADMRSMQWLFASAMPSAIQARGQAMLAKQFHPECIRPLIGVETNCAQAGAGFMECYMAITTMYKALLEHYAAGTPDPGRTYLSDGRVPAGATA
jgi:hypothetical protein